MYADSLEEKKLGMAAGSWPNTRMIFGEGNSLQAAN